VALPARSSMAGNPATPQPRAGLPLLHRAATHPQSQPRGATPRAGRTVAPHPQRRPSTPPSDPGLCPAGVVAMPAVWARLAGQSQHPLLRDRMPRLRSNATLKNDAASKRLGRRWGAFVVGGCRGAGLCGQDPGDAVRDGGAAGGEAFIVGGPAVGVRAAGATPVPAPDASPCRSPRQTTARRGGSHRLAR